MKTKLTPLILALTAGFAFGHGDLELGPNKGRILEFSANETLHGEVTPKDGKLHIALLDKDLKPVEVADQSITATAGTRQKPVKLDVAKDDKGFTLPAPESGQWLIIQFREGPDSKPVTARFEFDATVCGECKSPEWLCSCE